MKRSETLELLSPAGTAEAVKAACAGGADAIYLGYGDLNARRNAKNFSKEELITAVHACHLRGVKVYLTMNTLLTDRELEQAADLGAFVSALGMDAVLVQDIGVAKLLRETQPDLPLHASTQMSICNSDGADFCRALGMTRVVLARELPKEEIRSICKRPIEVEVFVHGALCMCYSGQCFLSSVIGGRSGNRGMCAQPCRLSYNGGTPLSLCDLSLVQYLDELRDMGVACIKIEGRMKRAEYVAVVTKIYADARKRPPTQEDLDHLELAFSRGFTQGYFNNQKNKTMFGTRKQEENTKELFAAAKAAYAKEHRIIKVDFFAELCENKPVHLTVTDEDGYCASVVGEIPEVAVQREMTRTQVETQLRKTGGTVFTCRAVEIELEAGLSVPLSNLNALRREALTALERQRTTAPIRRTVAFRDRQTKKQNQKEPPRITISLTRVDQLSETLCQTAAVIYLPGEIYADHAAQLKQWIARFPQTEFAVSLPRIVWDREMPKLGRELRIAKNCGARSALVGNWGLLKLAKQYGLQWRGDYGLAFFNSLTGRELERFGFLSATVSFELKFAQIRDLEKSLDTEAIVYGRLPLMITELPLEKTLRDRLGETFPTRPAWGGRSELLNSKTLFLADKKQDYEHIGLWAARFLFSEETAEACIGVLEDYRRGATSTAFTRGLYYRDVE